MGRALFTSSVLLMTACASAQTRNPEILLRPVQKEFTLRMYAPFLEPGLGGGPARAGDEITFQGPIEWTAPLEGKVPATIWHKKLVIIFRTESDRRTLAEVKVDLGTNGLNVWRHRHSYVQNGSGYAWNTLEDRRPALDAATGEAYDRYLEGVAMLWAKRGLSALLAGNPPVLEAEIDNGTLAAPIRVAYDRNGVVGRNPGGFAVRLWHMPAQIRFTVVKHEPSHMDPWIIQVQGPIEITYDAKEWRRRHGYSKGSGGYAPDPDFPAPKPDLSRLGPKLDELMERCFGYWPEAAVYLSLDPLDRDLKAAIAELGGSVSLAEIPPEPAVLRSLRLIEATRAW